jgi:hypothetical protein
MCRRQPTAGSGQNDCADEISTEHCDAETPDEDGAREAAGAGCPLPAHC